MANFPSGLKPSVSLGYSFDSSDTVEVQEVQGGTPLMMLKYRASFVIYNINIDLNEFELQVFQDFYYGKINRGIDQFNMNIDDGSGISLKPVKIVNNSISFDKSRAPINKVSFQVSSYG